MTLTDELFVSAGGIAETSCMIAAVSAFAADRDSRSKSPLHYARHKVNVPLRHYNAAMPGDPRHGESAYSGFLLSALYGVESEAQNQRSGRARSPALSSSPWSSQAFLLHLAATSRTMTRCGARSERIFARNVDASESDDTAQCGKSEVSENNRESFDSVLPRKMRQTPLVHSTRFDAGRTLAQSGSSRETPVKSEGFPQGLKSVCPFADVFGTS